MPRQTRIRPKADIGLVFRIPFWLATYGRERSKDFKELIVKNSMACICKK